MNKDLKAKRFTVIIPFYNEEDFLSDTLESFAKQSLLPLNMLLVNNNSSDNSRKICEKFKASNTTIDTQIIDVEKPGKIFALENVSPLINTEYAVYCDADTIYPQHYLETCFQLFQTLPPRYGLLMAIGLYGNPVSLSNKVYKSFKVLTSKLFPKKCHSGGYGQIFKTELLNKCGGYHSKFWQFVLMDHEIVHRLHHHAASYYHPQLWCSTSNRRSDRTNVRWTKWEQLVYLLIPFRFESWFFYSFFKKKLQQRKLSHLNLREKTWEKTNL